MSRLGLITPLVSSSQPDRHRPWTAGLTLPPRRQSTVRPATLGTEVVRVSVLVSLRIPLLAVGRLPVVRELTTRRAIIGSLATLLNRLPASALFTEDILILVPVRVVPTPLAMATTARSLVLETENLLLLTPPKLLAEAAPVIIVTLPSCVRFEETLRFVTPLVMAPLLRFRPVGPEHAVTLTPLVLDIVAPRRIQVLRLLKVVIVLVLGTPVRQVVTVSPSPLCPVPCAILLYTPPRLIRTHRSCITIPHVTIRTGRPLWKSKGKTYTKRLGAPIRLPPSTHDRPTVLLHLVNAHPTRTPLPGMLSLITP